MKKLKVLFLLFYPEKLAIFGLFILLPFCFFCCLHQNKTSEKKQDNVIFKGKDYTIPFQEKFLVHHYNDKEKEKYFDRILTLVRFCKAPEYEPRVQQVISTDGFLCSLKILPPYKGNNLLSEIQKYYLKKAGQYGKLDLPKKIKIADIQCIKWKMQMGKSRLYHYLIQGKEENYLFISSPYGNTSYLENIIQKMKRIKK